MKIIRQHPVFVALVAFALIAIGAEAWFFVAGRAQERALEVQLNQKILEIERLQRQRPGPTDENLRRVREDFAQNAEVLGTMLHALNVVGPDELEYFKGEPQGRTEAFFDIAQFVDAMRANGTKAGVLMRPEERFGFATYTNEGPEPELIRPVYRQRRIVEYLLAALFPARPRTLVGVQREDPLTVGKPEGPASGQAARAPAPRTAATFAGNGSSPETGPVSEIFTIDPQVSARTPGYVNTMAFRISFTGQTSSLRGFMNALAVPEIPLVVRSVEVEPLRAETGASQSASRKEADGAKASPDFAIVADNESRFTVMVELFEVAIRAPEVPATP